MNLNDILIRETSTGDLNNIIEVEKLAFGYDKEAKLVAQLLIDKTAEPIVSLVACNKGEVIGHILFTRAYFEKRQKQPMMHILAPLAVKPKYQRLGIGGILINSGIQLLQKRDSNLVFVLGHKKYYPKYGFILNAKQFGYMPPYSIPTEYNDCWMILAISQEGFDVGRGKIKCSDVLNRPEHWRNNESDR